MSASNSPNPPQGFFARLRALVVALPESADPDVIAIIAPEMPGDVFFASEPENGAGAKSDGA